MYYFCIRVDCFRHFFVSDSFTLISTSVLEMSSCCCGVLFCCFVVFDKVMRCQPSFSRAFVHSGISFFCEFPSWHRTHISGGGGGGREGSGCACGAIGIERNAGRSASTETTPPMKASLRRSTLCNKKPSKGDRRGGKTTGKNRIVHRNDAILYFRLTTAVKFLLVAKIFLGSALQLYVIVTILAPAVEAQFHKGSSRLKALREYTLRLFLTVFSCKCRMTTSMPLSGLTAFEIFYVFQ